MKKSIFYILLLALIISCQSSPKEKSEVQLYYNGDILTMEGNQPKYVETIGVENGKIVFVGNLKEAEEKFKNAEKIDLKGKTLLPGFIDPHSHFGKVSNSMGQVDLSPPPVGDVTSIPQILEKIKKYKEENNIPDGEWIFAWGYDDNQLVEKRHPTSKEIDSVLPNNPVYLDHTSGHMGVANSLALQKMKVTADTPNPEGGNIGRYPNSKEPNGLVQETAMYPFVGNMLQILTAKSGEYFDATQNHYAENGITTAQDGMIDRNKIKMYKDLADKNQLKIDLIALAGASDLDENLKDNSIDFKKYHNKFKVQGTKIVSDGSPQGKTAFFSKPYETKVAGCSHHCTGLPSLSQEALNELFVKAYDKNQQLFIHCNGDASIDMILEAHKFACDSLHQPLDADRRTIAIHSQFVRPDQLQKYVGYKIEPSYFTNHAYFWGDVHLENLGEERADFLSPIHTSDSLGLKYTNHSDATVTPLNPLLVVWSAVNRVSRSRKVIGEKERATPYEALKAVTINAAYEYFEENDKGSLEEGKLADLVILDENPLKVSPEKIKEIKVLETIKEGKSIFKSEENHSKN